MSFSRDDILIFTNLLRVSDDPMWVRIRTLLQERGIDAKTSILVESFPDDTSFYFGVLITKDGSVIQYGFDYLGKEIQNGQFSEWQDLTQQYKDMPYCKSVKTGMILRDEEIR